MKCGVISLFVLAGLVIGLPGAARGLDVGDMAPPLKIKQWVQGDPIQLPKDASKKVHVIEFWATWCPPCKASVPLLNDYQKKYAKDLMIVGVTDPDDRGNTPKAVEKFVKQQGSNMSYHVAIDDGGATTQAYMAAAGAMGIPHCFVVGRDAKIAWQGSPLDPALGDILGRVIEGTYDLSSAAREQEVMKRLQALSYSIQLEQWGTVWDGLVDILKIDPSNEVALDALVSIHAKELHNTKTFRAWVESHLSANRQNALVMERLAVALLRNDDYATRMPDLALDAAKAAYEASKRKESSAAEVYARAVYQVGNLDRAISLQKDALAMAPEPERKDIQKALDYYELCKKLQGSVD